MAFVAASEDSAAESDDGGSHTITITILIGSSTSRGDSGGGAVGDSYISPFGKVLSESNFN